MKIVEPKYEILTDISEGGIKELQQIERVARVCYKSEDKITPDGESAKKLVGFLVKQGHEAMLEHSQLSVLFTCDRAIANSLAMAPYCELCAREHTVLQLLEGEVWRGAEFYSAVLY